MQLKNMNDKKMIRKYMSAAVLLLAALILAGSGISAGEPRIYFKERERNFGAVKQGSTVSHVFLFSNRGDETLFIHKVSAG
jgi:hypothetical protein